MRGIKRSQLVNMNQHYRRFSMDFFLDCQQRLGIGQIELWCGAAHFWLDHTGYDDVSALRAKLRAHGVRVVSVTAPSIAYQYQYAAQEPAHLEYSFRYFSNAIHLAAELGADRVVVNSGWGYQGEDESAMWNRCRDHLGRLCQVAQPCGVTLVMESLRDDESNLVCNLERARRMHREVGHPSLKMMVDNIATGAAGETLGDWFRAFGAELIHMHFLDGDPWLHNVWGDGNTALAQIWPGWYTPTVDGPANYTTIPTKLTDDSAPVDAVALQGVWCIGIPDNAPHKDLALELLEYVMSPEVQLASIENNGVPCRYSCLTDSTVLETYPHLQTVCGALETGVYRPVIEEWTEFTNILGTEMDNIIQGTKTMDEALAYAQEQLEQLMA